MVKRKFSRLTFVLCTWLVGICFAVANNLKITDVQLSGNDATSAFIQFDISWENSWRASSLEDPLYFHDAAWVFFKVQLLNDSEWRHAKLLHSGVNPEGCSVGEGTPVELVVPEDGMGVFVRRAEAGHGTTSVANIRLIWDFASNDLIETDRVTAQAFGVEMVYVAKGPFWVGDTVSTARLHEGGVGEEKPFKIENAGPIECADEEGKLWGVSQSAHTSMGGEGTIPVAFPNGYNAFYCMKYEITQGQYTDFLNTLARGQQTTRCVATTLNYYMCGSGGGCETPASLNNIQLIEDPGENLPRTYRTVSSDRACNFLLWADFAAFSDWSGLRPMTELEFEKACRGPLYPVPGEYAWGTPDYVKISGLVGEEASGSEYYQAGNLNAKSTGVNLPLRVGIFARPGSSRIEAGASYWGIMELSGNMVERPITIGHAIGRAFTGDHGDGYLSATGVADVSGWPVAESGTGWRGGDIGYSDIHARTSDRSYGAIANKNRNFQCGGRSARSAP